MNPQAPKFMRMRGFSLVELMIAMTLGLLIMAALTTLFVDTSRTNREMAKTNSQIENARFAVQILQEDLAHAGYWGGFVPEFDDLTLSGAPTDVPAAIPAPCAAYASWDTAYYRSLIAIPVQFYNAAPGGCTVVANKLAQTDVIVVRHADTCATTDANCTPDVAGRLYFQPSRCVYEIEDGTHYVFGTTGFDLHARLCVDGSPVTGPAAPKFRYISNIYYIRDYAVTAGDGIPTLVRSSFDTVGGTPAHQAAVPLVEGIQGLRIEIGVDHISDSGNNIITAGDASDRYTAAIKWADADERDSPTNRGDGVPDSFLHCAGGCSVDQLANVSAARIYILARSNEETPGYNDDKTYKLGALTLGPFNDGFKRHVFTTTIRFINVTSRRETP
ncbi:MAG: hypothetical protein CALGDGBN_01563 [Pseudomonadales bacterium]|nr:hypothetical protein [Pseudomonadales bacterium]